MPGKKYEGTVSAINPLVDAAGRAIVIRAQVRNADTLLRPGMFTRVKLLTKDERDALVLPEQALVPQGEEQFVFRVVDGKAARTKVELGQRRDGRVEVVKGVSPGETIVTAGQLKLRDGTPVTLATVAKAGAAPKADNGSPPAKADSGAARAPKS
jgi:membrane fusion protein (multidrug efflux system)